MPNSIPRATAMELVSLDRSVIWLTQQRKDRPPPMPCVFRINSSAVWERVPSIPMDLLDVNVHQHTPETSVKFLALLLHKVHVHCAFDVAHLFRSSCSSNESSDDSDKSSDDPNKSSDDPDKSSDDPDKRSDPDQCTRSSDRRDSSTSRFDSRLIVTVALESIAFQWVAHALQIRVETIVHVTRMATPSIVTVDLHSRASCANRRLVKIKERRHRIDERIFSFCLSFFQICRRIKQCLGSFVFLFIESMGSKRMRMS